MRILVLTALVTCCVTSSTAQRPVWSADSLTLRGAGSMIGVDIAPLTDEQVRTAGVDGVAIVRVHPGAPALEAGIQRGDVVIEFDGERVRSVRQFRRIVAETRPGRPVTIVVHRGGAERRLSVTPVVGPLVQPDSSTEAAP